MSQIYEGMFLLDNQVVRESWDSAKTAVTGTLAKYGAEVLVATFESEALQGEPADGVVVLRFPSEQAIRDFVHDPDYRPLKDLRLRITTNASAVLAPEFEWPDSQG